MKQKCFLCGKEKEFHSYFKVFYKPYDSLLFKSKIPICPECRDRPISDIYKKLVEMAEKEARRRVK